jgi:hypothetical protein
MWMLLTAIVSEKYGCILLAGIDMATKEEYRKQRDGIYLAIDIALSKDIKILVPRNSRLFFETDAVLEDYRNRYLIVKRVPEYEAGNAGYDYGLGFRASRACERPLIKRLK